MNGLVIGKFYPPHVGHSHLIETGLANCDWLWVLVLANDVESISGRIRADWLQQEHPDAHVVTVRDNYPVDYDDQTAWDNHVGVMQGALPWGAVIDKVFASEDYGPELAARFNAEYVMVDYHREAFPISGSAIRRDPIGHWDYLIPSARADLVKRVVCIGPESSGTTTLARALADHYNTVWVPEYGRFFSEAVGPHYIWKTQDFELIARTQIEQENEFARRSRPLLICDTDASVTPIFHELYMGRQAPSVETIAANRRDPALYIVTDPAGIDWEDDGLRLGRQHQDWMLRAIMTRCDQRILVSGSEQERMAASIEAIDEILAAGWDFHPPIDQPM